MNILLSNDNPGRELQTLDCDRLASRRVFIWNAREDFDELELIVHRALVPSAYFVVPCTVLPSGVWRADIEPAQLPDAGEAKYEAVGIRGDTREWLGSGRLYIKESLPSGEASQPVPPVPTTTVYDETGAAHVLRVVTLDNGDLSIEVE